MGRLSSLQSLRGYAAILVVIDHLIMATTSWKSPDATAEAAWVLGAFGVNIFFVISGFIMYWISRNRFSTKGVTKTFFIDRVSRIIPLYTCATMIWFLLNTKKYSIEQMFLSIAFVPFHNPANAGMFPILSVGWTLNYEMLFYLIFGIFISLKKPIATTMTFLSLVLIVFLGRLPWEDVVGSYSEQAYFYTRPIILLFLIGIALGMAREYLQRKNRLFAIGHQNPAICLIIAIYAGLILYFNLEMHSSIYLDVSVKIIAVILVAIVCLSVNVVSGRTWRWFESVGDVSFSLYLVHIILIHSASYVWVKTVGAEYEPVFIILILAMCIGFSFFVHRLVEVPLSEAIRGVLRACFLKGAASNRDSVSPGNAAILGDATKNVS